MSYDVLLLNRCCRVMTVAVAAAAAAPLLLLLLLLWAVVGVRMLQQVALLTARMRDTCCARSGEQREPLFAVRARRRGGETTVISLTNIANCTPRHLASRPRHTCKSFNQHTTEENRS